MVGSSGRLLLRCIALSAGLLLLASAPAAAKGPGPVAPLGSEGRWITDAKGRVVQLRGVNEVSKSAPFYPAAFGFGADDARFLSRNGFNAVRLGVMFNALMPEPGVIDRAYIGHLAETVRELGRRGIFVLLDFHQDGFAKKYRGEGLPDWMGIDDGLANPPVGFPLYYFQNPAMQRAFENLWDNETGPEGVGLQQYFAEGVGAVARRFARSPYVFGYDVLNEPFPGADFPACLQATGCPEVEAKMESFNAAATDAIREHSSRQLVFVEPYLLFNAGTAPTSLPGAGTDNGLSFHSYAGSPANEAAAVDFAVDAADRDRAPLIATEFGATTNPETLTRLTAGFDADLVPWMFWAYNEEVIDDDFAPAGLGNLKSPEGFRALVRPYPAVVAGTPRSIDYDAAAGVFDLSYSTRAPDGRRVRGKATVVRIPRLAYPSGYTAVVTGARVTSRPCARSLVLRTRPRARSVRVELTPDGVDCGIAPRH
jgi:endoglycosylceramidase